MQTPNKSGLVVVSLAILVTVMIAPQLIPLFTVTPVSDDTLSTTSEPIPPGMLAYWELNEGDGTTVHDIVPPLVHGTTARSPAWVPGIAQSGLELLSDQYINFNSPTELYAVEYITIEAWVNLPDTTGLHTILMNSYISTYIMYHFGIQDGALYFDRQSGAPGNQFTSTATINADQWHHVAVVMHWPDRTVSFYIDGAEEIKTEYADVFSGPTGLVTIGADRTTGPHSFLLGMIDEVALYDGIVDRSTIMEHYEKGLLGLGYLDDIPTNVAPVALDDSYTMDQGTPLLVDAPGVLGNDVDADGDTLETGLVSDPTNGGLVLYPDGSFIYTPINGFVGVDAFEYRAFDGVDYSTTATCTITVESVNHPPIAEDDAYTTDEDVHLSITSPGVLANDHDPEPWDYVTTELVTGPQHGSLTLFLEGDFEYTPDADWFGTDSFTYRVFDGTVYGNVATVIITVDPVNDAPVAGDDDYSGVEDSVLVETTLLINDYDIDGDSLESYLVTGPLHGVLNLYPNGNFTFLPDANWFGVDSFTYNISDGQEYSNVATVTITILGVNDVPVASDDSYTGFEDIEISETSVLDNDYDADEDVLEIILVSGPSHGILDLNLDTGSFTFLPDADWSGTDTFTYQLYDGQEYSNVATVTLAVSAVNDAPVASDIDYYAAESTSLSIAGPEDLLALGVIDIDTPGDELTIHLVVGPAIGTLILNSDGSFEYSVTGYHGTVTFIYRAFDGTDYSNNATVTLYDIGDDDTTGPEISIIYSGDATDASPGTWTVTVVDSESGIDWINVEIDGVSVGTAEGTYAVPNSLGPHTITVTAANADLDIGLQDQETSSLSNTVTIDDDDVTGPSISITYTGDMTNTNPGFWTVTVSDLESGIYSILIEIDGVVVGSLEGDYAVPDSVGVHNITVTAINNDLDRPSDQESFTREESVFIEQAISSTEIIYNGDLSGVYSDVVYLEALLLDASDQMPIPGKTILFTLGDRSVYAVTNTDGVACIIWVLNQEEGVYELSVSFDGDDDYLGSSTTSEFILYRECATIIYSGVTMAEVSEESITLMATVFDDADGHWGNISHIYVTFTLYLSSDPLTPVYVTSPVRVQITDIIGVGFATVEIPNLPEGDYLIVVSLLPEHNRFYCSPDNDPVIITIYEPERAHAHGAGKIVDADGHNAFFVFKAKYNCKGTLGGFLLYTYVVDDWVYLVRSTEILSFVTDDIHAFFEASVRISRYNFETHEKDCSDDEFKARIDAFDNRNNHEEDVFQIRVFNILGLVEHEVGYDPFGYLLKGCIVVRHGRNH
ncbi:MAG: Ig-like domain-containing protein [Candidatus Thorarchaeota archaeon]